VLLNTKIKMNGDSIILLIVVAFTVVAALLALYVYSPKQSVMLQQSSRDVIYCAVTSISQTLVERSRLIRENVSKTAVLLVFVNSKVELHDEWMTQHVTIQQVEFENPLEFELFDAWQHLKSYRTAMLVPQSVLVTAPVREDIFAWMQNNKIRFAAARRLVMPYWMVVTDLQQHDENPQHIYSPFFATSVDLWLSKPLQNYVASWRHHKGLGNPRALLQVLSTAARKFLPRAERAVFDSFSYMEDGLTVAANVHQWTEGADPVSFISVKGMQSTRSLFDASRMHKHHKRLRAPSMQKDSSNEYRSRRAVRMSRQQEPGAQSTFETEMILSERIRRMLLPWARDVVGSMNRNGSFGTSCAEYNGVYTLERAPSNNEQSASMLLAIARLTPYLLPSRVQNHIDMVVSATRILQQRGTSLIVQAYCMRVLSMMAVLTKNEADAFLVDVLHHLNEKKSVRRYEQGVMLLAFLWVVATLKEFPVWRRHIVEILSEWSVVQTDIHELSWFAQCVFHLTVNELANGLALSFPPDRCDGFAALTLNYDATELSEIVHKFEALSHFANICDTNTSGIESQVQGLARMIEGNLTKNTPGCTHGIFTDDGILQMNMTALYGNGLHALVGGSIVRGMIFKADRA
jgi:hypothetical protein